MKTLVFLMVSVVLVTACTNVAVPPSAPVATPTISISTPSTVPASGTASPSTAPQTSSPTATSTSTPTVAPSASATPTETTTSPSTEPTPTAITVPPPGSDLERLMSHIPASFRQECRQVTSFDAGFVVGVQCQPDPLEGYVTYYLFDALENLTSSYESNAEFFGADATGTSCQSESAQGGYTIDGTPAGRLVCAPYEDGLIMFWTHDQFLIESTIVHYDPSYADLYAVWQAAGPNPPETGEPTAAPADWSTSASFYRGQNGEQFLFICPAGGEPGTVWGTDTYTDDSSVCTAAVHAGLITIAAGGTVTFEMRPGQDAYVASERNGIESRSWGTWSSSFVFVTP